MIDKQKLEALRICCAMLEHFPDNAEYLQSAAALARELFPVRVLVWSGGELNGWLSADAYSLRRVRARGWVAWFFEAELFASVDLDAAKAACEAHHQARFLEQIA